MGNISSCDDDDDDQVSILIPEDVLIQILVLLPVISLLRFKSVCKSWRALIQSSLFIHLHLNTTTTTTTNNNHFGTFICQLSSSGSGSGSGSGGFRFRFGFSGSGNGLKLKWKDLGFTRRYKFLKGSYNDHIFMVGSCNGLICMHDQDRREVSLWNPATRQFRLLPKSLTHLEEGIPGDLQQEFVAFGYDVKTNDYKVVQISCFTPYTSESRWTSVKEYIFQVQVYSLSTDSWRLLEGITSLPAFPKQHGVSLNHGVYLNGLYYFLGMYYVLSDTQVTGHNMILSFDFTKEIFTTLKHPHDNHGHEMILTCFGEKLALFIKMVDVDEDDGTDLQTYDIWVLNEHGVKEEEEEEEESWNKLHSIVPYSFGSGIPRAISNSGEFALLSVVSRSSDSEQLQLFNLVTKKIKKEFPTGDPVIKAEVYKQSLVSIGRNNTIADKVIGGRGRVRNLKCRGLEYIVQKFKKLGD